MLDRRQQDIVALAKAGNRQAFGELVQRYQNLVTSIAFSRTGDLQRSEDIAQQVFLIAWQKRGKLNDNGRYGGWLRLITRNVTLNSNRKTLRLDRSATSLESATEPMSNEPSVDAIATREQQDLLWASLQNIPEDYREPLILYYREDQSVKDVADQMGLSIDAVKQRLARGRAMLKSEVEQFVEDLLDTTKPRASFAPAIVAALPSVSATTQVSVKGGVVAGGKALLSKSGLIGFGASVGIVGGVIGGAIGIYGAWFGTKAAAKYATSKDEEELIWRVFHTVTATTLVLTALSVSAAFLLDEKYIFAFVVSSTLLYSIILATVVTWFTLRQTALHEIHGRPAYPGELEGTKPLSPAWLRFASIGSTIGCWTWVFIMGSIQQAWIIVGISAFVFLAHVARMWPQATTNLSGPRQMRYLAKGVMVNAVLASVVVTLAGFAGSRLDFSPTPNWSVALGVLSICTLATGAILLAAKKTEEKLAAEKSQVAGS